MRLSIDWRELEILQAALHLAWENNKADLEYMVTSNEGMTIMPEEVETLNARFNHLRRLQKTKWMKGEY
jgi:hypothetical protein